MTMTTITTLTTDDRRALVAKLNDLESQMASIFYRDASDTRTNAQIQHEVDELYTQIGAVATSLTDDADHLLPNDLPDHIRETAGIAVDPLAFLNALDDADHQRWCERDHA